MERGYIKLWRRIGDSDLMQNHRALALWLHLLTSANFRPGSASVRGVRIELQAGQALFGRVAAARELGMTEKQARTALDYLERSSRITTQRANRGTIVTVCNWHLYQSGTDSRGPAESEKKGQHRASTGPAPGQQRASTGPAEGHSEEWKNGRREEGKKQNGALLASIESASADLIEEQPIVPTIPPAPAAPDDYVHPAELYEHQAEIDHAWSLVPPCAQRRRPAFREAWVRALRLPGVTAALLTERLGAYYESEAGRGDYFRLPASFLADEGWAEPDEAWRSRGSAAAAARPSAADLLGVEGEPEGQHDA